MMRRSRFIRSAAALGAAAGFPTAIGAEATVKIGYVDSFSGGLADIGNHHRTAMAIAIDEANRTGRVKYELVAADDTSKPANGTIEARRLISQENVDVLMVGTSSAVTLAIGPLAEQTGIFTLAIGGQDTSITGEKAQKVVYRFAPNVRMQISAFGQRILSLGKKWYFIVDDFAYGRDSYARLSALVKRAGGSESGADILPLGTEDYSSALTKLRNSDAEVLVLCQGGFDSAKTIKQFVDFGLHKKLRLGGVSGSMEDYYWKSIPVDQIAGSTFGINWAPQVSDSAEAFTRKMAKLIREPISSRYYFPYVCTTQLIDRMRAAGTTRAEPLIFAFADHKFDAYKANPAVWRGCDHQCIQDTYAGAVRPLKKIEKTGFMFDIVAEVPGVRAAGLCSDVDPAAAVAAMGAQKVPERTGYEPKAITPK